VAPQHQDKIDKRCPHCVEENKKGERNTSDIRVIRSKTDLGKHHEHKLHSDTGPKTAIGEWMVNYIIPQFENNVMAFVYFGAALLVVIVGLRGVGAAIEDVAFIPDFLIHTDPESGVKHLSSNVVILALLFEFLLIATMAAVMFFKPEQPVGEQLAIGAPQNGDGVKLSDVESLIKVKEFFIKEIQSPLIDAGKKKQVEDFLPIIDYYIKEDNSTKQLDDSSFLGE